LDLDPIADLLGQLLLPPHIVKHVADAIGEEGGERKFAARVGRDFGILLIAGADDERVGFTHAKQTQYLSGEEERIARS
jgi:hypothetical protein